MTDSYDDLGVEGGRFEFKHGGLARRGVMNWSIAAFGNRPEDHLVRDLMFGSLERDRRLWPWRTLCKHKPPWMFADTVRLPEPQRLQIGQQRSFHYLHEAKWLELRDHANPVAANVIDQLRACWPVGSLVTWRGDGVSPHRNCRRVRQCPFCFARKVLQLYQQTIRAISPAPGQRGFLLMTATVTDDELHESGIRGTYNFVRRRLLPTMQNTLQSMGAHGGLVTCQVGPRQCSSHQWIDGESATSLREGFEYYVGVLGETWVDRNVIAQLESLGGAPEVNVGGVTIQPRLSVVNHLNHNSLRILLAGHMAAYSGEQRLADGRGLFVWPSLILASYEQWRERLDLLEGRHLYDRWGSWIGMEPVPRRPRLRMGRRRRNGEARRLGTIHRINRGRKEQAEDRTDALMQQHGDFLRQLAADAGRPPGRSRIRSRLQRAGIEVSEKDSRRLAEMLKKEMVE